ncbi:MAG: hypothetical protein ACFFED_13485 [Candidatus Thorarchaeota archaeon]
MTKRIHWRMIFLLDKQFIDTIMKSGGMLHVSGAAGSGKTLFASILASILSEKGYVDWISTDGKAGFVKHIRSNLEHYGGISSNISVTRVMGYDETLQVILSMDQRLKENTRLIVIDSITRVLDMSRNDPLLWGRTLFEDALPTLASISEGRRVPIVLISEIRESQGVPSAVYHEKIRKWAKWDLVFERPHGLNQSKILQDGGGETSQMQIGTLQLNPAGWANLTIEMISMEVQ